MQRLNDVHELRRWREQVRREECLVGFVPTMGALHAGHASLLERSSRECERTLLSIFVNPLQFNDPQDFARYPQTLEADLEIAARTGVDAVFLGRRDDLYPAGFQSFVEPRGCALPLEGEHRQGHFAGVATIVLKLLSLAQADRAYFGEKDWQQLQVVRALVLDFHLECEIVPCATLRESDGLALSSRNTRLDPAARRNALAISRALGAAARAYAGGARDRARLEAEMQRVLSQTRSVEVEYAVVADAQTLEPWAGPPRAPRALIAARVGGVRLIDNAALDEPPVGPLEL
ncbi:MAG: pantoate--beta-alanine ligase [Planctomycetes bacterium]|nr:pantoate--beta-alanine ligase [Planctomycetota bacterium]